MGHIDEDGFVFVDGRIKEMITRYDGFKIYPSMFEKVINSIEEVASCKVVGIDDNVNGHGQVPKAFVVLKKEFVSESTRVLKNIQKRCKQVLPEYYVENSEIECIEKLPLTSIGKVDFNALKERENGKNKTLKK